jgi:hypothetical protein
MSTDARPTSTKFRQPDLAVTDERAAILQVRESLRALVAILPSVPAPEWWWYDLNRDRVAADMRLTLMCRAVLAIAKTSNDPELLRRARALVDVVLDDQRVAIFLGHELPDAQPLALVVASVAKEFGEATAAIAHLAAHPSESNRHTARVELAESVDMGTHARRVLMRGIQ